MTMLGWLITIPLVVLVGIIIVYGMMNRKLDDTKMHYYMFSIEDVNHIVYVTSKEKMSPDQLDKRRLVIGEKFKLSDESSLNIGVSYIGYFSEKEMSKPK